MTGYAMETVYVASRADGWHKIGVTYDATKRCKTLSRITLAKLHPIVLVRAFDLGGAAPTIEKVAHREMADAGYEIMPLEWFDAPADACIEAVQRAITLIDEIGLEGWRKRRVRAWHKRQRERAAT